MLSVMKNSNISIQSGRRIWKMGIYEAVSWKLLIQENQNISCPFYGRRAGNVLNGYKINRDL